MYNLIATDIESKIVRIIPHFCVSKMVFCCFAINSTTWIRVIRSSSIIFSESDFSVGFGFSIDISFVSFCVDLILDYDYYF